MKRMFVTDYDGTLAADDGKVSQESMKMLEELGKAGVVRVIATGRSLFSLKTVVNKDFPIDYLVFSSGIGIYDWNNNKLLQENDIGESETSEVYNYLIKKKYDFMVQLPVPNNHFFHHFSSGSPNPDLLSRVSYYATHGIKPVEKCPSKASQFVIVFPEEKNYFDQISKDFSCLKVLKATSPIDRKSIWIEILPKTVSKSEGIEFLREMCNINKENIITVGNDYYDIDMLRYVQKTNAFVVSNAPAELKSEFNVISSNQENGVAGLVSDLYF